MNPRYKRGLAGATVVLANRRSEYLAKLEEQRLQKLADEQALQEYLERQKSLLLYDMSISTAGGGALIAGVVLAPPTGGLSLFFTLGSAAVTADNIIGDLRAYDAIEEGTYNPNREYKIGKEFVAGFVGSDRAYVYDLFAIIVGVGSTAENATKIMQQLQNVNKLKEREILLLVRAIESGTDSYSVGNTLIDLK